MGNAFFRTSRLFAAFVPLLIFAPAAQAMQEYYDWWLEEYSAQSDSGESVCQLCHKGGGGGNGWNPYGWDIRQLVIGPPADLSELSLKAAYNAIESFDSGNGNSYLQEIQANAQPGWREGEVNLIKFSNGNADEVIEPPEGLCGVVDPGSAPLPCAILDPQPTAIPRGAISIELETIATGLTAPVQALSAPGEPGKLYVVEQGGTIQRVDLATGVVELFLDLSAELVSTFGTQFGGFDERGLIGVAFHPDYVNNNKLYTYISKDYVVDAEHFSTMPMATDPDHQAVISEWLIINPQASPAAATAELELLIIDQPQFNHNGGSIEFGPDGYLYIALGDGGGANDEDVGHGSDGNGRDNTNPLGAILRIDVDSAAPANGRYDIPATNPFVGGPGLDEIYHYGFRNPYRMSFEPLAGNDFNLWVGDVGQNAIEEVDRIHSSQPGGNYGWNYKEGSFFFYNNENGVYVSDLPPPGVMLPPLVDPLVEYDHDEGLSVIGGYVYTGAELEDLAGRYVFADWGSSFSIPGGRLFYIDDLDQMVEFDMATAPDIYITGFGRDSDDELYVVGSKSITVNSQTGELRRIVLARDDSMCFPILASNGNIATVCL